MNNKAKIKKEESSNNVLLPGIQCPPFYNIQAVMEDGVTTKLFPIFPIIHFMKSYVVLFFFSMDRSSVDYSELMAIKGNMENFAKNDCKVVGITSNSFITIKNWMNLESNQGGIGGPVNFPIISDETMDVAKMFGVSRPSGIPHRATFILDRNRIVRHSSVYSRVVGRSVEEVLRTLKVIKKIDQNIRDNTEKLCGACMFGDQELVENILGGDDVDINGSDRRGYTPLIRATIAHATIGGHLDIVRRLLEHPGMIQLGKRCVTGYTALHFACVLNDVSIVQLLCLDSRCSPVVLNKKDRTGSTPLMIAVRMGHLDIVRELDIGGTDFFTKDSQGRSLMEVARHNADVLQYLMERSKVDSLKVIAAVNVARCVKKKAYLEALDVPATVRQFLAGFVDDEE